MLIKNIIILIIIIVYLILPNNANDCELIINEINQVINFHYDNIDVRQIPLIEMSNVIVGGCSGGGSCVDYPHTCDPGCVVLSAKKCSGGIGNCQNNLLVWLCRCGSTFSYTYGCN